VHPDERRLELVGDFGRRVRACDDVAAADVDLVGERERDRVAGARDVGNARGRDDLRDAAFPG
jgi:hypothetical protein